MIFDNKPSVKKHNSKGIKNLIKKVNVFCKVFWAEKVVKKPIKNFFKKLPIYNIFDIIYGRKMMKKTLKKMLVFSLFFCYYFFVQN